MRTFRKFTKEHRMTRSGRTYYHYRDYHGRFTKGKYRIEKPSWTTTMPPTIKHVGIYGTAHSKEGKYKARVEARGTGNQLLNLIRTLKGGYVPRRRRPYIQGSADRIEEYFDEAFEEGEWIYEQVKS